MSASSLSHISFGGCQGPGVGAAPSWRNGVLADWELEFAGRTYQVHKVIVARASGVLAACVGGSFSSSGKTNLADLLPEAVAPVFEDALDDMYDPGQVSLDSSSPVLLFVVADILSMKSLFQRALKEIEAQMDKQAVSMLRDLARVPATEATSAIAQDLVGAIARNFASLVSTGHLLELGRSYLLDVLTSEALQVPSEDAVADVLLAYDAAATSRRAARAGDGEHSAAKVARLDGAEPSSAAAPADADASGEASGASWEAEGAPWEACRLAFLSLPYLLRVRMHLVSTRRSAALLQMVSDAALYRNILLGGNPHCEHGVHKEFLAAYAATGHLHPRRPAHIPAAADNEVDLLLHVPERPVVERGFVVESASKVVDDARVSILGFPCGTGNAPENRFASVFVKLVPAEPRGHGEWEMKKKFGIGKLPWEPGKRRHAKFDTHVFTSHRDDRGWHDFIDLEEEELRCELGFVWIRACVKRDASMEPWRWRPL